MCRISVLYYKKVPLLSHNQWFLMDMVVASGAFWKFIGKFFGGQDNWEELLTFIGRKLGRWTSFSLQGVTAWRIVLHCTWFLNVSLAIHVVEKLVYDYGLRIYICLTKYSGMIFLIESSRSQVPCKSKEFCALCCSEYYQEWITIWELPHDCPHCSQFLSHW